MYADTNFRTKKALKEAVAAGAEVTCWQAGGMFPDSGAREVTVEGPWAPEPHRWYARVTRDERGIITKVR